MDWIVLKTVDLLLYKGTIIHCLGRNAWNVAGMASQVGIEPERLFLLCSPDGFEEWTEDECRIILNHFNGVFSKIKTLAKEENEDAFWEKFKDFWQWREFNQIRLWMESSGNTVFYKHLANIISGKTAPAKYALKKAKGKLLGITGWM